jgi:hypothetical protein
MSDGFQVNLTALLEAAEGVNGAIAAMASNKVSDIGAPQANYGNEKLAGTASDFCSRWETGVQNLTTDGCQFASRLALSAVAYAKAEKKNVSAISGIMRRSNGTDPAASQW